jgi:hypothetical protein
LKTKFAIARALLLLILQVFLYFTSGCHFPVGIDSPPPASNTLQPTLSNTPSPLPSPTPTRHPSSTTTVPPSANEIFPPEAIPRWIELSGPITNPEAEISGLAWAGDSLVLLPQFPDFDLSSLGSTVVFTLSKEAILKYLKEPEIGPLTPEVMSFEMNGIADAIIGYEGFEGIVFHGETFFVTFEATGNYGTNGYIASGQIDWVNNRLILNPNNHHFIEAQTGIRNLSDESITIYQDQVYTIYEANGVNFNWNPIAHRFDVALNPISSLPFPAIEYRITDVTTVDSQGRFWALNISNIANSYFLPDVDPLVEKYGQGPSHAKFDLVERLIQLQITETGIELVDTPPLQLNLQSGYFMRNWEGLAQLDELGFLLVTDKFPATLLAFISLE